MINLLRTFFIVNKTRIIIFVLSGCFLTMGLRLSAQDPLSRFKSYGGGGGKGKGDTLLKHRSPTEDSITINFRYLDSSRLRKLDSSINDFSKKIQVPWNYIDLGNLGTASHNLIFSSCLKY